jgi:hypothetical protein
MLITAGAIRRMDIPEMVGLSLLHYLVAILTRSSSYWPTPFFSL